ncbi:unnamed protein product [Linum tenue]|uniref:DNA replication complex GINS protein PSF2 N-terminal domain-containing protein n=1 Tax=Linum tenue TaxID=586396 RepID=A0AAV0MB86_9ROSI|nr:unnamed protein product [Linum tenue]
MAGQSGSQLSLFTPDEVEFVAEDELVEIVPNLRMDSLNFICGDYGPFYPQIAIQVPLWLALALKKRGKCTIRPPQWMSIEDIRDVRFHKVETNLENFTASAVTWKNMAAMEVNIIRAFSGRALQAFYRHENEQAVPDLDRTQDRQPQNLNDRPRVCRSFCCIPIFPLHHWIDKIVFISCLLDYCPTIVFLWRAYCLFVVPLQRNLRPR